MQPPQPMTPTSKQPATPLPWRVGDAGHTVFGPKTDAPAPQTVAPCKLRPNAAYIAHACNAYPKLIEALRAINGHAKDSETRQLARDILSELGED